MNYTNTTIPFQTNPNALPAYVPPAPFNERAHFIRQFVQSHYNSNPPLNFSELMKQAAELYDFSVSK